MSNSDIEMLISKIKQLPSCTAQRNLIKLGSSLSSCSDKQLMIILGQLSILSRDTQFTFHDTNNKIAVSELMEYIAGLISNEYLLAAFGYNSN